MNHQSKPGWKENNKNKIHLQNWYLPEYYLLFGISHIDMRLVALPSDHLDVNHSPLYIYISGR